MMEQIYAALIRNGVKTLEDVPDQHKEEVRVLLENNA